MLEPLPLYYAAEVTVEKNFDESGTICHFWETNKVILKTNFAARWV